MILLKDLFLYVVKKKFKKKEQKGLNTTEFSLTGFSWKSEDVIARGDEQS